MLLCSLFLVRISVVSQFDFSTASIRPTISAIPHALRCASGYLLAVEGAFGADIDYATLTKIYGNDLEGEKRYSPPSASVARPAS